MGLFAGKTKSERNKLIAAAALGLVALVVLYLAFGRGLFGGSASATTKTTPTPTPKLTAAPAGNKPDAVLPSRDEQEFTYQTTMVDYRPSGFGAPDPGRNIFSFVEPPPPCKKDCPTPTPKPTATPVPPTPTPTPVFAARSLMPQMAYAGSKGFKLEVIGERFTPDARIYFSQAPMPTTFVNEGRLTTDIPASFLIQDGPRQITVQSADGKSYSDQLMFTVQAPPKPTFQYIGMIGRARNNNNTAYFLQSGAAQTPFGARLNDVVSGRFRLIDMSPTEVIFQDVDLGFKHRVPITKSTGGGSTGPGFRPDSGFTPFNPGGGNIPQGDIPGIPNNIQRYVPPQQPQQPNPQQPQGPQRRPTPNKDDPNDDGDGQQ